MRTGIALLTAALVCACAEEPANDASNGQAPAGGPAQTNLTGTSKDRDSGPDARTGELNEAQAAPAEDAPPEDAANRKVDSAEVVPTQQVTELTFRFAPPPDQILALQKEQVQACNEEAGCRVAAVTYRSEGDRIYGGSLTLEKDQQQGEDFIVHLLSDESLVEASTIPLDEIRGSNGGAGDRTNSSLDRRDPPPIRNGSPAAQPDDGLMRITIEYDVETDELAHAVGTIGDNQRGILTALLMLVGTLLPWALLLWLIVLLKRRFFPRPAASPPAR